MNKNIRYLFGAAVVVVVGVALEKNPFAGSSSFVAVPKIFNIFLFFFLVVLLFFNKTKGKQEKNFPSDYHVVDYVMELHGIYIGISDRYT